MRFIYTKTFAIFAVCIVVLSLLSIMQAKGWLEPVRQAFIQSPRPVAYVFKSVASPIKNFFSAIYRLKKISEDNVSLKQRVASLEQQLVDFDQGKRENEALRKQLGFVTTSKYKLAACTVIGQNPSGLTDMLVLNCGSRDGVNEGQVIISQGYVVGKIIYTDQNSSTVLLVTSSGFRTDGELSKTGNDGVVAGSFGSGIILDRLPQNLDVQKGWLVSTAGIDPKVPKGLLIGQVGEIISSPNELFKKVTIINPVDLVNLDFVFAVMQ